MTALTEEQLANLSDDEIMQMQAAPAMAPTMAPAAEPAVQTTEAAAPQADETEGDQAHEDTQAAGDDAALAAPDDAPARAAAGADGDDDEDEAEGEAGKQAAPADAAAADDAASKAAADQKEKAATSPEDSANVVVDYKAEYEKILAPFKANGKEIKLTSADEAIKLMQMGANYTKKLQALQPNLKLLKMLENNGLLDEGKLSYLIDIEKKDPRAIQKLVKDSGIDPLDLDTTADPAYKPGNHRVSDEEMRFATALEEASADPVGKAMIVHIDREWDKPSKELLWKDPAILKVITDQKANGLYDQIATEVERQKLLGNLPAEPFIGSYMRVGQMMTQQGLLRSPQPAQNARPVVDTRAVSKTPAPANNDRAKAASPTRTAPRKVAQEFNPLSMSDEDFEKNTELARRL